MTDELEYKEIRTMRAAVDFKGSEGLERAKKNFLVFLVVLLFLEFADVTINSASLAIVSVTVGQPWAVNVGFWCLFIYTFVIYSLSLEKEKSDFTLNNKSETGFFAQLTRAKFQSELNEIAGNFLPVIHSGQIRHTAVGETTIIFDVKGFPPENLRGISGYGAKLEGAYTYVHCAEDLSYLNRVSSVIKPALKLNFLSYVAPAYCGLAMVCLGSYELTVRLLRMA